MFVYDGVGGSGSEGLGDSVSGGAAWLSVCEGRDIGRVGSVEVGVKVGVEVMKCRKVACHGGVAWGFPFAGRRGL